MESIELPKELFKSISCLRQRLSKVRHSGSSKSGPVPLWACLEGAASAARAARFIVYERLDLRALFLVQGAEESKNQAFLIFWYVPYESSTTYN